MQPLHETWRKLNSNFNQATKSHQISIAVLGFAIIFILWFMIFYKPMTNQNSSYKQQISQTQTRIAAANAEISEKTRGLADNPYDQLKRQEQVLQEQSVALKQHLSQIIPDLMSSNEMIKALRALLKSQNELHLVSLESVKNQDFSDDIKQLQSKGIYKHHIMMQFNGDYFTTLAYLQKLEQLDWPLFWESLDYQVTDYPQALVTVKLYTLSTDNT